MKKIVVVAVVVLFILFFSAITAFAGSFQGECPDGFHQVGVTQSWPPAPICVEDELPAPTTSTTTEDVTTTVPDTTVEIGTAVSVTAATPVETKAAFTG